MPTGSNKCGDIILLSILLLTAFLIFFTERPSRWISNSAYSTKHLIFDVTCVALFTTTIMVYSCRAIIESTRTLGRYFSLMTGENGDSFPFTLKAFILFQVVGITCGDFLLAFLFVFEGVIRANAKPSTIRFIFYAMWASIFVFLISLVANSISVWIKCTGRDKRENSNGPQVSKIDLI
jgi:hypothetical protein